MAKLTGVFLVLVQKYKEKLPVQLGELTDKVRLWWRACGALCAHVYVPHIHSSTEPLYALLGGMPSGFAVEREQTEARPILVKSLVQ